MEDREEREREDWNRMMLCVKWKRIGAAELVGDEVAGGAQMQKLPVTVVACPAEATLTAPRFMNLTEELHQSSDSQPRRVTSSFPRFSCTDAL
jgi:hypothetical protein